MVGFRKEGEGIGLDDLDEIVSLALGHLLGMGPYRADQMEVEMRLAPWRDAVEAGLLRRRKR